VAPVIFVLSSEFYKRMFWFLYWCFSHKTFPVCLFCLWLSVCRFCSCFRKTI